MPSNVPATAPPGEPDRPGATEAATTAILIEKDYLHFGAAHFTIFSSTDREHLHGHNFFVKAALTCTVGRDGLAFDYNIVKTELKRLCDQLDEQLLVPSESPHLTIGEKDGYVSVAFNGETMLFLPRDVRLIEVANVTVEALAEWFMSALKKSETVSALPLQTVTIGVSSGPGQWAEVTEQFGVSGQGKVSDAP